MWDGHLGRINIAKYRIDLAREEVLPIYSTFYCAEPAAWKFSAVEIDRMLAGEVKNLVELSQYRQLSSHW